MICFLGSEIVLLSPQDSLDIAAFVMLLWRLLIYSTPTGILPIEAVTMFITD